MCSILYTMCCVLCVLYAMSSVQKAAYLPLVLELLVTLCAGQQLVLGGAGHLVYWLQGDWGWLVEKSRAGRKDV